MASAGAIAAAHSRTSRDASLIRRVILPGPGWWTTRAVASLACVGAGRPPGTFNLRRPPDSGTALDCTSMLRFSAETMPLVTVPERPSGAPIAIVVAPTLSFEESANWIGTSPCASVTWMTAMSMSGSMPTTVAL